MKSPIQFLLTQIEDFVDEEAKELRERARNFQPETGLDKIQKLTEAHPQDEHLAHRVLERLSAFFDAGLLMEKSSGNEHWWITDLFWKGIPFHLEEDERVQADRLVLSASPVEVLRAPARPLLKQWSLEKLSPSDESDAFLIRPTPQLAYLLISDLPAPWLPDHVSHAQRLINNSFLY